MYFFSAYFFLIWKDIFQSSMMSVLLFKRDLVCTPFQLLKKLANLYDTWYQRYLTLTTT